jgi:threonyl-tRNA synthetase
MPVITLPDGTQKSFDQTVTVEDVALSIGAGLAKAALAGKVNGELVDTRFPIEQDAELSIITSRDQEGLDIIRHSTAHLLAHAVESLYPAVQVTIGPVIEDGFFYDFAFGRTFTPEDLEKIETRMKELVKKDMPIIRKTMSRDEAIEHFKSIGEHYKVEIIKDIPKDEILSAYEQDDFMDLCRGPHVPSTGKLGVFKLTKVAGAYWRGDSKNEMLQRIYGTAWPDKKQLKAYLTRLEEAEKRDHRKIAKQLNLFHMQEQAPGMVFWHGKGWNLFLAIQQYIRDKLVKHDYQEIRTPIIADRVLWEKSGHWDKFKDDMFTTSSENRDYAVKPMSCPCHVQVFNQGLKSYRDLPLRLAEFGMCHRNEPSGALHGIMRVRGFTQDDAHIFCTEEQVQEEVSQFIDLLFEVYKDFGFADIIMKLSTRPEQRLGSDEVWDRAEKALADALNEKGVAWDENPGEGAFYGPKIEFSLKDCLGRVWQCGTVQLDFSMPERLGAEYVAEDGTKKVPAMIHRAITGSLERFIAILIEHYEGKFPLWLAPEQVVLMNITDNQADYLKKVVNLLKKDGIRVISDLRNEKIGYKIREHTLQRVPYLVVVGDKEVADQTLSVRKQSGEDLGSMSVDDFTAMLKQEIADKVINIVKKTEE